MAANSEFQLFDICVNLTASAFARDYRAVLQRARLAGIRQVLIPGSDLEDSKRALLLVQQLQQSAAEELPELHLAFGCHPHQAKQWQPTSQRQLANLLQTQTAVAVGECGLDYNRNLSAPAQQRLVLQQQLELAVELQLPVFLHQRDAHADFLAIIKEYQPQLPKLLVHCFTDQQSSLLAYVELDCYIGITGWFCDERRGRHLAELVRLIPPARLVLESDAPYLLPRDLPAAAVHQSGRNEPAYLPHLLRALSACLARPPEELASSTLKNSLAFLNL